MDGGFREWLERTQGDLSDNEVGRKVGVSATMIGKYKRGAAPAVETLRKFAAWSGAPVDYLEKLVADARIARLMITCPKTKKPLPTGIAATAASFATMELARNSVRCPHCGELHTWDKKDAYLEGQAP